jgi:anaerobic carbon-monoxide dehydrogenase iron sulfur subunit
MKRIIIHPEKCTGCRLCESICALYHERMNDLSRSRIRIVKKHSIGFSTPVVCFQCKNPPCGKVCPVSAITKDTTGVVKIDEDLCFGCEACVSACPFGVMMAFGEKVAKCDLCEGDPQCVKYCATEAIVYGEVEQISRQKRGRILNLALEDQGT